MARRRCENLEMDDVGLLIRILFFVLIGDVLSQKNTSWWKHWLKPNPSPKTRRVDNLRLRQNKSKQSTLNDFALSKIFVE